MMAQNYPLYGDDRNLFKKALIFTLGLHLLALISYQGQKREVQSLHFSQPTSEVMKVELRVAQVPPAVPKIKKPIEKGRKKAKKKVIKVAKKDISKKVIRHHRLQKAAGTKTQLASYITHIRTQIEGRKQYPLIAKKRRQQGVVVLQFTVDRSGRILESLLKKKSPYNLLNKASLKTLKSIEKFAPFPKEIQKQQLVVSVPMSFKLI